MTLSWTRLLRYSGLASILGHWQPWALLSLGTAGLLLSANAYQAGTLASSLPIMDTIEPVSGVLIGTMLFGERLAASRLRWRCSLALLPWRSPASSCWEGVRCRGSRQ